MKRVDGCKLKVESCRPVTDHRLPITEYFLPLCAFLILAVSCTRDPLLPPASGKTGEVIAVVSNELFSGKTGEALRATLAQPLFGLPQPEALFRLNTVPPSAFTGNLRTQMNVVVAEVSASNKPGIYFRRDVWASGQFVVNVIAEDDVALAAVLRENAGLLTGRILAEDRHRTAKGITVDRTAAGAIARTLGIGLDVPAGFRIAVNDSAAGVVWLRSETAEISSNLLVSTRIYTDTADFLCDTLRARQNEITRKYVPGPSDSSWMKISQKHDVRCTAADMSGNYAVEMRGLWDVENDFMGGPFIAYSVADTRRGRIVTVLAFVFAPGKDKRDLVQRLDAILWTLRLGEGDKSQ